MALLALAVLVSFLSVFVVQKREKKQLQEAAHQAHKDNDKYMLLLLSQDDHNAIDTESIDMQLVPGLEDNHDPHDHSLLETWIKSKITQIE